MKTPVCLLLIAFVVLGLRLQATLAGPAVKILVLPFDIHAEKDLSFLNSGISAMLSARLTQSESVEIIAGDLASGGAAEDQRLAADLGADFFVTGSLTIFGNSVSTDARCVEVADGKPLVTFSRFGQSSGDVLSHIDLFASQVNERLADRLRPQPVPAATPTTAPQPPVETPPVSAPLPVPPALPEGQRLETATASPTPPVPPTAPQKAPATPAATWKSETFDFDIRGLAAGDVDDDGQSEAVVCDPRRVHLYRRSGEALVLMQTFTDPDRSDLLGVDLFDSDHDGRMEIFVTALNRRGRLGSFVLGWDGNDLRPLLTDANWYFRVLTAPGKPARLIGQQRGIVSAGDAFDKTDGQGSLFLGGIFELSRQNGTIESGARLSLPGGVNLFGFAVGDPVNGGREMTVAMSGDRRLRILADDGTLEWESGERYGGTTRYLEYPGMDGKTGDRFYLPQRVLLTDMNRDGRTEIVAVRNTDASGGFLGRLRAFTAGQVDVLVWNRVAPQVAWQTDAVAGHVSDVAVADLDHDGRDELVLAVIAKSGTFAGPRSYLLTWKNEGF